MKKLNPDWRSVAQNVSAQFRGLEGRHPGLWPAVPRALFCATSIIAVLLAGWWFIWIAQWEELEAGRLQELQQKEAFRTKLAQAQNLDQLREQKIQVEAQVKKLEQQLPSKAEMDALLSDINQAGIGRGLQFELFKPGPVQLRDYYAELPINIKLTGSYHALAAFTSDIAHLPRIVTLDKISISNATGNQRDSLQNFEAVARTFRYLDKDEVALQKKQATEQKGKAAK